MQLQVCPLAQLVDGLCEEHLRTGTVPFAQWTKKGPKLGLPSLRQLSNALARLAQLMWEAAAPEPASAAAPTVGNTSGAARGETTVYVGKIPHKLTDSFLVELLRVRAADNASGMV